MLLGLEAKLTPGTTGGHYGGAGDLRTPPWRKPARPTGAKAGGVRCRTQRLEQQKRGQTWAGSFRSVSFASQSGVQAGVRDGVWNREAGARVQ